MKDFFIILALVFVIVFGCGVKVGIDWEASKWLKQHFCFGSILRRSKPDRKRL